MFSEMFFTMSRRGHPILETAGYRYHQVLRDSKGVKKRWNCVLWNQIKCRATLITIDGEIIKTLNEHIH